MALDSPRPWFEGEHPGVDAFISTAEAGYAWTLLYPEFQVVIPKGVGVKNPHAIAVAGADPELAAYLERWCQLMEKSGELDELYDHWILGKGAESTEPRWSIVRDVLGWAE